MVQRGVVYKAGSRKALWQESEIAVSFFVLVDTLIFSSQYHCHFEKHIQHIQPRCKLIALGSSSSMFMRPLYLARRRTLKGGQHRVVPVDEVAPLVLAELRGVA